MQDQFLITRRNALVGASATVALVLFPANVSAQGLGLGSILGKASDSALDQLAQPGAFYNDEDVRIGLPIVGNPPGGLLGSLFNAGRKLGILDGITRKINDAAGAAAGEAKPIFRAAIDDLSFSDVPGIVRDKEGGSKYLRSSANDELHTKVSPLVDTALSEIGVYEQFDGLAEQHSFIRDAGLNRESINKSVTDQALDGIFAYMGREERKFRDNPLDGVGKVLGDLF
jgi:hypothetical protein